MHYRVLGNQVEYQQAAKRLEELTHAQPGTPQDQERQELIRLFREFEREIRIMKTFTVRGGGNQIKTLLPYKSKF